MTVTVTATMATTATLQVIAPFCSTRRKRAGCRSCRSCRWSILRRPFSELETLS